MVAVIKYCVATVCTRAVYVVDRVVVARMLSALFPRVPQSLAARAKDGVDDVLLARIYGRFGGNVDGRDPRRRSYACR
jgi:hypothetical protein